MQPHINKPHQQIPNPTNTIYTITKAGLIQQLQRLTSINTYQNTLYSGFNALKRPQRYLPTLRSFLAIGSFLTPKRLTYTRRNTPLSDLLGGGGVEARVWTYAPSPRCRNKPLTEIYYSKKAYFLSIIGSFPRTFIYSIIMVSLNCSSYCHGTTNES